MYEIFHYADHEVAPLAVSGAPGVRFSGDAVWGEPAPTKCINCWIAGNASPCPLSQKRVPPQRRVFCPRWDKQVWIGMREQIIFI
jgi:hypothetical protein